MAPRRASVGATSSSVGSCAYCTQTLILDGFNWTDAKTDALFAFQIIAAIVLIVCLVLAARFKWVRKTGSRDHLRRIGYVVATVALWVFFVLSIIPTALQESEAPVTYLFYLIYIFSAAAWRISDVVILAIILRTLYEGSALTTVKPLPTINMISTLLLTILATATFGMYTAVIARLISDGPYYYGVLLDDDAAYVNFAYDLLYFLVAIIVAGYAALVFVKDRSKGTLIMLTIVAPALFLRSLMNVVEQGVSSFPSGSTFTTIKTLSWATSFLYTICSIAIFLGIGFIGCLSPLSGTTYNSGAPTAYTQNGPPGNYQQAGPVYYNNGPLNAYQGTASVYYNNGVASNELPAQYSGSSPVPVQEAPTNYNKPPVV